MSTADAEDWTKPITVLTAADLAADQPDWTTAVIEVSSSGGTAGLDGLPYDIPASALSQTFPRGVAQSSNHLTSGLEFLNAIPIPANTSVGHLVTYVGSPAMNLPTHWWMGLYDNNFNLLAITADQGSTALGASVKVSLPIANTAAGASSTFVTTYSGLHYISIMYVASSTPVSIFMSWFPGQSASTAESPQMAVAGASGLTTPHTFPYQAPTSLSGAWVYGYVAA